MAWNELVEFVSQPLIVFVAGILFLNVFLILFPNR